MTQHSHSQYESHCFRCELSRDEAEDLQRGTLARRKAYDFDWLVATLRAIGGDIEDENDAAFAADELLDSTWFRAVAAPVVSL